MHRRELLTSTVKAGFAALFARTLTTGLLSGVASKVIAAESRPSGLPASWHWLAAGNVPSVVAKPALPTTVTDGTHSKVTVNDVSKIIVGGDDIADILAALGMQENVYASPDNSISTAGAAAPVHFKFNQTTSTEGLLSIGGTLFIGDNLQRHGSVAAQFRDAGVSAVVVDNNQSIPDKIRAVARYVGATDAGEELAGKVQRQLDQARKIAAARIARGRRPRMIAVTASGAAERSAVYGTGTAAEDIINTLGAIDVGVEMGLEGYSIKFSQEGLLKSNPDIVLLGDADLEQWQGASGLFSVFPTLRESNAGASNNFIVMPSELIKIGGVGVGAGALALANSDLFSTSQN